MVYGHYDSDPIAKALAPPANETAEQAQIRLRAEAIAIERSRSIDEALEKAGKKLIEQRNGVLKMLLLGQSGSGKTTVLKNIRMMEVPSQWNEERPLWRAVILLNLLLAVNLVVQALQDAIVDPEEEIEHIPLLPTCFHVPNPTKSRTSTSDDFDPIVSNSSTTSLVPPAPKFAYDHHTLKLKLGPLKTLIEDLEEILHGSRQFNTNNNQ
ncbi:uncharacterized protein PHACADRAFT_141501, partial [Phanerochaete carnosa HHB-10118-sp]